MSSTRKFLIVTIVVSGLLFIVYQALATPDGLTKPGSSKVNQVSATTPDLSKDMQQRLKERIEERDWISAKVVSVRDGDTVELVNFQSASDNSTDKTIKLVSELNQAGRIPMRLLAVDTPESTKIIQQWGNEASEFTKSLVEGKRVYIEFDEKATYDKYGRILGHLFTNEGSSVQMLLLERGYARVAYLFDKYKYVEDYKKAEKKAKQKKINIHSLPGYVTDKGFNMNATEVSTDKEGMDEATYNDILNAFELLEGLTE